MQLDAATKDSELNAEVKSQRPLLERLQTAFRRAASLDAEQRTLVNGIMKQQDDALGGRGQGERRQPRSTRSDRDRRRSTMRER